MNCLPSIFQNQLLGGARDNLLTDSPLKKMVHVLPNWMKAILAPKEQITGEELGVFMGALVTITSYIVTFSNKDLKVTALGAFAALLGIIIGKSFNNMVTYISMVCITQLRSFSSLQSLVLRFL